MEVYMFNSHFCLNRLRLAVLLWVEFPQASPIYGIPLTGITHFSGHFPHWLIRTAASLLVPALNILDFPDCLTRRTNLDNGNFCHFCWVLSNCYYSLRLSPLKKDLQRHFFLLDMMILSLDTSPFTVSQTPQWMNLQYP